MATKKIQLFGKQFQLSGDESTHLESKGTYKISSSRDASDKHIIELNDDDRIELRFEDNTIWFGDTNSLNDVFPDMEKSNRSGDTIELPSLLHPNENQRGISSIGLKVISIFAKKKVKEKVFDLAKRHEINSLGNQSGLFSLNENMDLIAFDKTKTSLPYILFIHGTFSSTIGSFGELRNSETWRYINQQFTKESNRILGFQHETLTKSPLQNVLELVTQLPSDCTLNLITHSRGGLVGDLCVLFAETKRGFSEDLIQLLEKENRKDDVNTIRKIQQVVEKKKIKIDKYIRVACPANGTSLLSKKIDTFFNVMLNIASMASGGNTIVTACKELISTIIDSKNDTSVLPGLEAMNPSSPFLKVLNSKVKLIQPIESSLAVISGNSGINISLKALKVLLLRMVFQSDNDLVVNTISMYQGAKRKNNIQYFFDEGSEVEHTSYFKNENTQKAIYSVLISTNKQIAGYREYLSESINTNDRGALGLEGGQVFKNNISGKKPIVLILPGIMGSNLEKNERSVWINYVRMMTGGLAELKINEPNVKASSLIKTSYKNLAEYLEEYYDVVTVPFDWRRSLIEAGESLNQLVNSLLKYKQPIKILAHSMGGLVARELLINHSNTWNLLNNQAGFRLLLLGTPWLGSFRIPSVLSGNDGIIKMISKLDLSHSTEELIDIFSKFPGLLNLLPIHGSYDFGQVNTWNKFRQATQLNWSIPDQKTISEFNTFQKKTLDAISKHRSELYENVIYVAGKDKQTPSDYTIENGKIRIHYTNEGDQSVTWASGIPAKVDKQKSLYYVNVSHGALSCDETLFEGIKELLHFGTTSLFDRTPDKVLTSSRSIEAIEEDILEVTEENTYRTLLGIPKKKKKSNRQLPALKISVSNGDLQFSTYPVLIGHFYKDGIISAEKAADRNLKGVLTQKHSLGIYPGALGTHLIELNENFKGFKGVIIAGLGTQENLTVRNLSLTVEQAMMSYMVDYCKKDDDKNRRIGVSALLVGSFYGGIPILNSLRAIITGVANANKKISIQFQDKINLIEHIEFIEIYEDRALQSFNTLNRIIASENEDLQIEWLFKNIKKIPGLRKRIADENIRDWWHRITVKLDYNHKEDGVKKLFFSSSTDAAREENQDLYTNVSLVDSIIKEISEDENWSPEKSKAIFELLVPNDFKHNLHSHHNINWVVDKYAAGIPWELLQTSLDVSAPLCVAAKMVRQLATSDTSKVINPSKNNRVLIIGDPKLNGYSKAAQLAGAKKEAELVYEKIKNRSDFEVNDVLINSAKDDIITALLKTDYKVIHLAGHGVFDPINPHLTGMLIGKKKGVDEPVLLTTKEITQMSNTPELVFVNCCYLGKMDASAEIYTRERYKFAANIGTQLIENGVKAVVVGGWAVDDDAALHFADIFYKNMLEGRTFGDAVFEARRSTYRNYAYTNTWGAYQCYGDPFYSLVSSSKAPSLKLSYTIAQEVENDLDNFINDCDLPNSSTVKLRERLEKICTAIEESKLQSASILEKEAFASLEINDFENAITKFSQLLEKEKANYTITAIEKYNNTLTKSLYASTKKTRDCDLNYFDTIIQNLNMLLLISDTAERYSLIGNAYKRKAACQFWMEKPQAEIEMSLLQSIDNYRMAFECKTDNKLYPLCQLLELQAILHSYGIEKHDGFMLLQDAKTFIETELENIADDTTYKTLLLNANATLCLHLISESRTIKDTIDSFNDTWEVLGSNNKKENELEHFDLLLDFCYFFDDSEKYASIKILRGKLDNYLNSLK